MLVTKAANRLVPMHDLDFFANQLFGASPRCDTNCATGWLPSVSVEERDEDILLTAELPGLSSDAVEISLENNVLTISGEKTNAKSKSSEDSESVKYHLAERTFGAFRRSFTLPQTVSAEKITADFDNGILTVHLPKAEQARSRKIEIRRST